MIGEWRKSNDTTYIYKSRAICIGFYGASNIDLEWNLLTWLMFMYTLNAEISKSKTIGIKTLNESKWSKLDAYQAPPWETNFNTVTAVAIRSQLIAKIKFVHI
jgi:hypothetical protein